MVVTHRNLIAPDGRAYLIAMDEDTKRFDILDNEGHFLTPLPSPAGEPDILQFSCDRCPPDKQFVAFRNWMIL